MTVDIPDAIAKRLNAGAARSGLSIENYILTLLEKEQSEAARRTLEPASYEEWRDRLDAFRRTRRTDLPVLSDESLHRESLYEGR